MAQRRFEELEGHLGTFCTYSSEFGNRNPFYWKRQKKLFTFDSLTVESGANVLVVVRCSFAKGQSPRTDWSCRNNVSLFQIMNDSSSFSFNEETGQIAVRGLLRHQCLQNGAWIASLRPVSVCLQPRHTEPHLEILTSSNNFQLFSSLAPPQRTGADLY